ncbi:Bin3-domain-containing protein [Guyanagaster necrorhizus]|uniref:RNA methyltransferase n=1 Tax=Guyanagaster necrorhizus TaxID=856835 RepID=A0A9P8AUJ4_9AGAR|nr:Bin3-domain-containing protein [Guyanagaster necrorhizus MCA 3950]KAG7446977.1 Bin3-domain-containing protein [Guyanagaster necrorhizus MCA 3950]
MDSNLPIYGNYHGYYSKRPFVNDPRLALLPVDSFVGKRVLDVGCNEGYVTCEIAQSWGAHKVIGVDIDKSLVRAAWRRRTVVWSTQSPSAPGTDTSVHPDHFPLSFEHTFGSLPIPPNRNRGKHVFPHNVSFRASDWVNDQIPEDSEPYDIIIAFSISKWIHLNQGDEGLQRFFHRVYSLLRPGGTFVFEPQSWDTYKKAKRLDKNLMDRAATLKIRPEEFESLLSQLGFGPVKHFGLAGEGGFRRPVDLYVKL